MQIGCIIETIGGYCPLTEGDVNLCDECGSIWLKSEHKEIPKPSDAERVILENLPKDYKWICRDSNYNLILCTEKPIKLNRDWSNTVALDLEVFNHLFQFITWDDSEPYNIEELLKGK